jgi:hypothetical protein
MTIDIDRQIKCVAREIALRRNVYPKWTVSVNGRKPRMTEAEAAEEIAAMEAVIETLKTVKSGSLPASYPRSEMNE